jgi:hypothetical protein
MLFSLILSLTAFLKAPMGSSFVSDFTHSSAMASFATAALKPRCSMLPKKDVAMLRTASWKSSVLSNFTSSWIALCTASDAEHRTAAFRCSRILFMMALTAASQATMSVSSLEVHSTPCRLAII